MAAASDKQAGEDACGTMQAALGALKDSRDVSLPRPTKQQLSAGAQLLRMEVAKLGLLYGGAGARPSATEREALLKGLQNAVAGVCAVLMGAAGRPGAGPTLRAAVHATAEKLVKSTVDLTQAALVKGARGDPLMGLVGLCMEQCDALAKAPLDNKTAIGRVITQVLKTLADASRELSDIAPGTAGVAGEAPALANGSSGEGGQLAAGEAADTAGAEGDQASKEGSDAGEGGEGEEEEEEEEDFDDFGLASEELSMAQAQVVRSVRSMLDAVSALLKVVVRVLLLAAGEGSLDPSSSASASSSEGTSSGGSTGSRGVGWEEWEGLLFHIRTLATAAEDLAAAIYPPQDPEELESAAEAVVNGCELICEETPIEIGADSRQGEGAQGEGAQGEGEGGGSSPQQRHVAELQRALAGVEAAHERLMAGIAKVREEEEGEEAE